VTDAAFRIVCLGTSLTGRGGWTDVLAARLAAAWRRRVQVHAVAADDTTSRWGRRQLAAVLAYEPDLVLIEFAINDAYLKHLVTPLESRRNHRALIRRLRRERPDAAILLATMSPAHGWKRWLLRPFLERHFAGYRRLSRAEGVGLVDTAPLWCASAAARARDIPDGLHPTHEAQVRITVSGILRHLGVEGP
jgi:acyl-CoA thioesterase I